MALTRLHPLRDRSGALVAVHRRRDGDDGKTFDWLRPDGSSGLNGTRVLDLPLFGIHHAHEWPDSETVVLVEGEKAALALIECGVAAVGTLLQPASRTLQLLSAL